MYATIRAIALLALTGLTSATLAGCGSSSVASSTQHSSRGAYESTCNADQYVGNRRSKVLHPPGDQNLPSPRNQVCFDTATAGEAAGYHLAGSGSSYHGRSHRHHRSGSSSSATTIVIPGRPRPQEETFRGCPPAGSSLGDRQLNLLKNRIDMATPAQTMSVQVFEHLPWPQPISIDRRSMDQWSTAERKAVYRYEGMAVRIEGYLAAIKQEGRESPNCEGRAGLDWHLWLSTLPHMSRGQSIIVESTPRIRARTTGFSFDRLASLLANSVKLRISGWAMLDYEHADQLGKTRATLWELHPITHIEAWRGGQWVTVAG